MSMGSNPDDSQRTENKEISASDKNTINGIANTENSSKIFFSEFPFMKKKKSSNLKILNTLTKTVKKLLQEYENEENNEKKRDTAPDMKGNENNEKKKVQLVRYYTQFIPTIIKFQSYWRKFPRIKQFKIMIKKARHRKFVIQEIIKTEEIYVRKLKSVIGNVIIPALENGFLLKNEIYDIFCNIEEICDFHSSFLSIIIDFQNNYHHYSIFVKPIIQFLKNTNKFNLYFDYCNNFDNSQKIMKQKKSENDGFSKWLSSIEFTHELSNGDIESLLVMPVQRLPKYILLFRDLLKNTDQGHPDYCNIEKAIELFSNINEENNSKMDEYLRKLQLKELKERFLGIFPENSQSEFLIEEAMFLLDNDVPMPVTCYFLTDLLIVTEQQSNLNESQKSQKLIHYLTLNESSKVRNIKDTKYFQHLFSIYGLEGGLVFCTNSLENKMKNISFVENIINKHKGILNNEALLDEIQVQVVGTCEQENQGFLRYTLYIIEIKYANRNHRLFLRYKELKTLEYIIRKKFPNLNFKEIPKSNWFKSQKTKTIENRQLHIERFLQIILQNNEVKSDPKGILEFLSLPPNFYKINFNGVRASIDLFKQEEEKIYRELKEHGAFSVQLALKKNFLSKKNSIQDIDEESNSPINSKGECLKTIKIYLENGNKIDIPFTKKTTASDICLQISQELNMACYLDFKLFLIDNTGDERVINDDELINVFEITTDCKSFFQKLKNKFKQFIKLFTHNYHIIFKKYLFFPNEMEELDYKKDPVKLDLMVYQIFNEVLNLKYLLSFQDYALFAAFQIYLENNLYEDINFKETNFANNLKKYIPVKVLKQLERENWKNKILYFLEKISNDVFVLSMKNKVQKSNNIFENLLTEKMCLIKLVAINAIKSHELYGSSLFWVNLHKEKSQKNCEFQIPDFLWLAIDYVKISLITPNEKKVIKVFLFEEIKEIFSFPTALKLILKPNDFTLRLNTKKSFEIYQLIYEYQKIKKNVEEYKTYR